MWHNDMWNFEGTEQLSGIGHEIFALKRNVLTSAINDKRLEH